MQTTQITRNVFTQENKIHVIIWDYNKKHETMEECEWWKSITTFQFFTQLPVSKILRAIVRSSFSTCSCYPAYPMQFLECVPVVKCTLLLSVHCCKNKQDLRGFQHCSDQLKQSSPISAGKARCHAALSETRLAAAEIQPCKSSTAKRWSWYRNMLKERKSWPISQSTTSSEQGWHKGISEREKETRSRVGGLEFTDTAAGPGKSYLLCFMFSIWMEICCFMLKVLRRTSWRKSFALTAL